MDYEMAWKDTVRWLDKSIDHLNNLMREQQANEFFSGKKEYERLKNKLNGLKTVQSHMYDSVKIYGESKGENQNDIRN